MDHRVFRVRMMDRRIFRIRTMDRCVFQVHMMDHRIFWVRMTIPHNLQNRIRRPSQKVRASRLTTRPTSVPLHPLNRKNRTNCHDVSQV